ncbi:flagellar export chaperone FlgN, partial [Candidatus Omnitrophota bacterium]
ITLREMELGLKISEAEKKRQELVKECKEKYNIDKEMITIRDLSSVMEEPYSSRILRKGKELKELLTDIMDARALNNKLIQKLLGFNERNIKLFMNLGNKNLTYDDTGVIHHSRKQVLDSVV